MNRVISFSLYGDSQKYIEGAVRNAELAPKIYHGWTCLFYIDEFTFDLFTKEQLDRMQSSGARNAILPSGNPLIVTETSMLAQIHNFQNIPKMMWRFLVADDPNVERFIVRDCDSRLSEREARACDEWIADDTVGWILRDHPAHAQPMMGGLWGAMWRRSNWEAPKMETLIRDYLASPRPYRTGEYADDQLFLQTRIWPWLKHSCTQHDSICRNAYPGAKPFPTKRIGQRFCGEVMEIDEHGNEFPREHDLAGVPKEE